MIKTNTKSLFTIPSFTMNTLCYGLFNNSACGSQPHERRFWDDSKIFFFLQPVWHKIKPDMSSFKRSYKQPNQNGESNNSTNQVLRLPVSGRHSDTWLFPRFSWASDWLTHYCHPLCWTRISRQSLQYYLSKQRTERLFINEAYLPHKKLLQRSFLFDKFRN